MAKKSRSKTIIQSIKTGFGELMGINIQHPNKVFMPAVILVFLTALSYFLSSGSWRMKIYFVIFAIIYLSGFIWTLKNKKTHKMPIVLKIFMIISGFAIGLFFLMSVASWFDELIFTLGFDWPISAYLSALTLISYFYWSGKKISAA